MIRKFALKPEFLKFDYISPLQDGSLGETEDFYFGGNTMLIKHHAFPKYYPEIYKLYDHCKNVALKIRNLRPGSIHLTLEQFVEQTIIQNIFASFGIAPYIYDILLLKIDNNIFQTQILEEIKGNICQDRVTMQNIFDLIQLICDKVGIEPYFDCYRSNIREGKLVDFDRFHFINKKIYENYLIKELNENAISGTNKGSYQQFPQLGITKGRSLARIFKFGLDKLDLTNKTVLEIGCSGGAILNYLSEYTKAKRLIGVDFDIVVKTARKVANFLGNFKIEYYGYDLKEESFEKRIKEITGIEKFDIIIIFSMNHHIGFRQYMYNLAGGEVYVECNNAKPPEEEIIIYKEEFSKLGFDKSKMEYCGQIDEAGHRALLKLRI